jgi:hypothetical protein
MGKKSASKEMAAPVAEVMDRDEDREPKDYEVEDAVRTMERAEEIKRDKKLMPHVHKHIGKKMKSLKELKRLAGEKAMEEQDED